MNARALTAIAGAGFRRYSTYRQATLAGAFTNTVFGLVRTYTLLSVAAVTGQLAGYTEGQLITYVWVRQGLIAVVNYWGQQDLPDRVRSGEVVSDLLRPVGLMAQYLATDAGRAGHAMLTRFVIPVAVGFLAFDPYLPSEPSTYALFALSTVFAVAVCSLCRYMVSLTSFWLLDIRGVQIVWTLTSGMASGLYFPLALFPEWLETALWVGTPFPALLQAPLDVLVGRGGFGVVLGQAAWVLVLGVLASAMQRRALRRLVIQGG